MRREVDVTPKRVRVREEGGKWINVPLGGGLNEALYYLGGLLGLVDEVIVLRAEWEREHGPLDVPLGTNNRMCDGDGMGPSGASDPS